MAQGPVKWFYENRGFGFIARDDGTGVFIYHSSIQAEGLRACWKGTR